MKKKYLAYALIPAAAAAFWGVSVASAHGWGLGGPAATPTEQASRFTAMVQQQSSLLGMTEAEVKQAWAEGKTMEEMATAKGLTQEQLRAKMEVTRVAQQKEHLQALVDQGVITQAQADTRLKAMEQMKGQIKKGRGMRRGGEMFGL